MFSVIVVGTDDSQTARRAVAVAAELARRYDAELHVVHAYLDPSAGSDGPWQTPGGGPGVAGAGEQSMWHLASQRVLDDALADPVLEGVKAHGHSVPGNPQESIIAVANEIGAQLIVVGSRGLHSPRAPTESVPFIVARDAPCHVLIARTT